MRRPSSYHEDASVPPVTRLAAARRVLTVLMLLGLALGALPGRAPSAARAGASSRVYLPLVASGTASTPPADKETSEELIDRAVAEGKIDAETALGYKVFALFGDPRLPAAYRGATPPQREADALEQVAQQWSSLSAATRTELASFLIPPVYANSWANRPAPALPSAVAPAATPDGPVCGPASADWTWIDSLNGKARFWWKIKDQAHGPVARLLMREWDNTVYPQLTKLMGREHLSDVDEACNGLGERLDIYVVEIMAAGFAYAYLDEEDRQCGPRPTYLEINPKMETAKLRSALAHEYMHALQWAFKVKPACYREEYKWWMEATGSWAMHYVYPQDNADAEHPLAKHFQERPAEPVESRAQYRHYGAYLLPFKLATYHGDDIVRRSWEAMAELDPHTALNGVMPGGWQEQWPEFVKLNWNRRPADAYTNLDKMALGATPEISTSVSLAGKSYAQHELLPSDIPHLAARYYRFELADPAIRSAIFENPYARGSFPTARVQALYRNDAGEWSIDDWTAKPWKPFCRDKRDQRITELVIVVSNHEWQNLSHTLRPASPPRLHLSNVACRGWKVEAEATTIHKGPTWEWTGAVKTEATFMRYRPDSVLDWHTEFYRVADGTASWTYGGHIGQCGGSGSGSYSMNDPNYPYTMVVETYGIPYGIPTIPAADPGARRYTATGTRPGNQPEPTVTVTCPNQTPFEQAATVSHWLQTDWEVQMQNSVDADGKAFTGSLSRTQQLQVGSVEQHFTWKMTALPPE